MPQNPSFSNESRVLLGHSLKFRLLVRIFVLMLIASTVGTYFIMNSYQDHLKKEADRSLDSIIAIALPILTTQVWLSESDGVFDISKNILSVSEYVEFICVDYAIMKNEVDNFNQARSLQSCVARSKNGIKKTTMDEVNITNSVVHKLTHIDETVGWLRLGVDERAISKYIEGELWKILLTAGTLLICLCLVIFDVVGDTLKPLKQLTKQIQKILNNKSLTKKEAAVSVLNTIIRDRDVRHYQDEFALLRNIFQQSSELVEHLLDRQQIKINHINKALQEQNAELIEANEQMTIFNKAVYHESKRNEESLRVALLEARDQWEEGDLEGLDQSINDADRFASANRDLMMVLKTILDVRQKVFVCESIELDKLVRKIWRDLEGTWQHIEKFTLRCDPGTLSCDRKTFELALTNIIENAVKYSEHASNKEITITFRDSASHQIVGVLDQGVGFDMHYYQNLLNPMARIHNSEFRYKGMGMGLYIAHKIAQKHNGFCWGLSPVCNSQGEIVANTGIFILIKKSA